MRFTLKGTNLLITPILREYVERKMAKLEKLADALSRGSSCRLDVGRSTRHHRKGRIFRVEINCEIPGFRKRLLRSESEHWEIRLAFDEALREMQRQMREFRGKIAAKYRAGARELKRRIREEE